MLFRSFCFAAATAAAMLNASTTFAQYYSGGCSSCGTITAAPVAASCTPIQPVYSTCYQTVPVTTYQREQQTVKVPYYKTAYREQEVTTYRPVTQQREVEVPTVSYQNVTEMRTVNRDMGRWVTRYNPVQKCAPCQVDPRPGMLGWLNRTGYSFRTAFMPNYTTSRQYVPNMVSCQVPYTRQVAIRGTRRVTINETRMVAEKKMERVPVQQLAYREETVTVMKPQTAYRTVPIGTSMAYGYGGYGYGSTATAFAPYIIDGGSTRTALSPEPDPISNTPRSANRSNSPFPEDDDDGLDTGRSRTADGTMVNPTGYERPLAPTPAAGSPTKTFPHEADDTTTQPNDTLFFDPSTKRESKPLVIPATYRKSEAGNQTSNKTSGWRASRRTDFADTRRGSMPSSRVSLTSSVD